jgi:integrase
VNYAQTAKLVRHHPPLYLPRKDGTYDYSPVVELVALLGADENVTNLALEFTLLTGLRMSEARHLRWSYFDLDAVDGKGQPAQVLTVPSHEMKGKKERKQDESKAHIVPLSPRCVEILRTLEGYKSRKYPHVVFPSQGAGIHFKEWMGESNLVRNLHRHLRKPEAFKNLDDDKLPNVHGFRVNAHGLGR